MLTSNELAIVFFPLAAALFMGSVVWGVTANAVRGSRIKQAKRAKAKLIDPADLDPASDAIIQTSAGTYFKVQGLEQAILRGIRK